MWTANLGGRVLRFSFSSPFSLLCFIREAITQMPSWREKSQERKILEIFALFLTVATTIPPFPSKTKMSQVFSFSLTKLRILSLI